MHFLLILVTVFTDAFPIPPVHLYAYYSRLNFTMLRVAMLKDVRRQLSVWGVFKYSCQKLGQNFVKLVRVAV